MKLISAKGFPQYGVFNPSLEEINKDDFLYLTSMDKPRNWFSRWSHFKEFQYIGVISEDLIIGCALINIKFLNYSLVYFYLPKEKIFREFSFIIPGEFCNKMSRNVREGECSQSFFKNKISMMALGNPVQRKLSVRLSGGDSMEIVLDEAVQRPLSLCTPTGFTGWTFTQKFAGLPVSGTCTFQGKEYILKDARGSSDVSMGYMRRETNWRWSSLSGKSSDGRPVGLNLAAGVNETGFTENAFWLDNEFNKIGPVHFSYNKLNPHEDSWYITTEDNSVDLRFHPLEVVREKLNFIFLSNNSFHIIGKYEGTLTTLSGEKVKIDNQLGFAESHFAKW